MAVLADRDIFADDAVGSDFRSVADVGTCHDDRAGVDADFFRIKFRIIGYAGARVDAGRKFSRSCRKVANDDRECQCWILDGDERAVRIPACFAALHDDRAGLGSEKLRVVFLVTEKAHIACFSGIEGCHSGIKRIELAPDDVTIDPTGELGKREVFSQFPGLFVTWLCLWGLLLWPLLLS